MKNLSIFAIGVIIASLAGVVYAAPVSFAAKGLQILNKSSGDYQTTDPTACSGVTFPGPAHGKVPAGYLVAKQTQVGPLTTVTIAPTANGDCSTIYKGKVGSCTISFKVKDGAIVKGTLGVSGNCTKDTESVISIR